MSTRHVESPEQAVDRLEHTHHNDLEAVTIQMQAVGRTLEELAAALEALASQLPDGAAAQVSEHLDQARWELKNL